jgi:hypothetical protein
VVTPGDIDPSLCVTNLGNPPFNEVAGMTYFFTLTTIDIYGNNEISSLNDTDVTIIATYIDNSAWSSPIGVQDLTNWAYIYGQNIAGVAENNNDGTYTCQFTVYRAGTFSLSVQVNSIDVVGSPWEQPTSDYLYISPSDIYGPNCVIVTAPTSMIAGTASTFNVQGRDFYANNI